MADYSNRNYSPYDPADSWGLADATPPYVVRELKRIADCICLGAVAPPVVVPPPVQPKVATPVFVPPPGTYGSPFQLFITDATSGAELHYTIDGSTPDASSPLFDTLSPITLLASATVKAIGMLLGYDNSDVVSGDYVIDNPQAALPIFSPVAGSYPGSQAVSITSPNGGTLHYTLDGSAPTALSPIYAGPITINTTTTIKAIAVAVPGYDDSGIATALYTITPLVVANPTFLPTNGTFTTDPLTVTISTVTAFASIYYTLDGSPPTILSTLYTGPFNISTTTTIKALAVRSGYTDSGIVTKVYTFAPASTQLFWWGGSNNDSITDFSEWHTANPVGFAGFSGPSPQNDFPANFDALMMDGGAYAYFCRMTSSPPPLPPLSGGFKNGSFPLNVSDFASPATGFPAFSFTDPNGWPCIIGINPDDGLSWTEYRLLNQPFATITLTVDQV